MIEIVFDDCSQCGGRGWLPPRASNAFPEFCPCGGRKVFTQYTLAAKLKMRCERTIANLIEGRRVRSETAFAILSGLERLGFLS